MFLQSSGSNPSSLDTTLADGHLVAVRADQADLHIEGKFWLALVMGPTFAAPADMAVATDVYEEGWLIVPIRWFQLEAG